MVGLLLKMGNKLSKAEAAPVAAAAVGTGLALSSQDAEAGFVSGTIKGIEGAGRVAPDATKANLMAARAMEMEGADPRTIYEETGFFRAADGKMRYEVAEDTPEQRMFLIEKAGSPNVEMTELDPLNRGSFYPQPYNQIFLNKAMGEDEANSVLAHELQHGIQNVSGFAGGGSPTTVKNELNKGYRDAQRPLREGYFVYEKAYDHIRELSAIDAVSRYRTMANSGNLTGKRRLLVGNSNWYEFGDQIRRELGPEPKRHRPKAEREQWLQAAWSAMADKVESQIDDMAYHELYKLSLVKNGKAKEFILNGLTPEIRTDQGAEELKRLSYEERVQAGKDALAQDPTLARKKINQLQRVIDAGPGDDAFAYAEIATKRREAEESTDFDLYEKIAGEVEARNVQTRINMTPEERRQSYPPDTEDVPRDQQLIVDNPTQRTQVAGSVLPQESLRDPNKTDSRNILASPVATTLGAGYLGAQAVPGFNEKASAVGEVAAAGLTSLAAPFLTGPSSFLESMNPAIPVDELERRRAARQKRVTSEIRSPLAQAYAEQAQQAVAPILQDINQNPYLNALPFDELYEYGSEAVKDLPARLRFMGGALLDSTGL